jgi:hypothetical protein
LKFYYNLSRGKIGAGVNAGMLFNGTNTMQTYKETDLVKTDMAEVKNKGFYQGVNTKNILLSAFYTHRLTKRMSANVEVLYGLSDTYLKMATKTNTKENNMGLRLSLQYTLFDK